MLTVIVHIMWNNESRSKRLRGGDPCTCTHMHAERDRPTKLLRMHYKKDKDNMIIDVLVHVVNLKPTA